ncbi:hypothetical protein [Patulibacter sp. SYSU D01012]|uniref:hypothetical protein n=1 Tax=Patulibacter sp. SYSU D01012 TaxID=2817381 RepID=UPI001B30F67F|nr:hypothetical protein [Patulibacter sp. SYSU D01012]
MFPSRTIPLVLTCAAAALAGCGSGKGLLDGSSAEDLQKSVSAVEQAVADGRCDEAASAAREGLQRVGDLPSSVDGALKDRLREGFRALREKADSECEERTPTTETTPPPTTETTPPETTETTPPETTPDDTTTTDPDDTTTTDPGGGTDPGSGPDPGSGEGGGTTTDDGSDDDSGGISPGVDAPGASERGAGWRERTKELRDRARAAAKEAREAAREALKGGGGW